MLKKVSYTIQNSITQRIGKLTVGKAIRGQTFIVPNYLFKNIGLFFMTDLELIGMLLNSNV